LKIFLSSTISPASNQYLFKARVGRLEPTQR
jgi:hypothetical protein